MTTILLQKFIRHLHRYESLLLGMAGSSRLITEMQRLLGFGLDVTGPVTSPPTHVNLSATEWTRLCGVISAYRLLDVIFFLGDSIPRTLNTVERQLSPNGKSLHVRCFPFSMSRSNKFGHRVWTSLRIGHVYYLIFVRWLRRQRCPPESHSSLESHRLQSVSCT